ncbi:MAG: GTPase [Planctomycetota bacterium]|jgi:tRNA modification GTPase
MSTYAAVMTGKGVGAISTIQVFGDNAETVVEKIFIPANNKPLELKSGKIILGTVSDDTKTIDQVTIGCEGVNNFAVNCHGNPLIVADIMQLLQTYGTKLLTAEELLAKTLSAETSFNSVAIEAILAQAKAKTIEGTKILANQIETGLNTKAKQWLQNIEKVALNRIKSDAEHILIDSQIANLIICGCKTVLVGPPNTGKSTLLNCLSGRQKAIVTDIKGTTRDWVSAGCQIGALALEMFDTAGLDVSLTSDTEGIVEKEAQEKSIQILKQADLVLLVLDNSRTTNQIDDTLLEKITGKKILTVLNKSDLAGKFNTGKLPEQLTNTVQISAKFETGIDHLREKISLLTGTAGFDLRAEVCTTARQKNLLEQLKQTKSTNQAVTIITELLNGKLCV